MQDNVNVDQYAKELKSKLSREKKTRASYMHIVNEEKERFIFKTWTSARLGKPRLWKWKLPDSYVPCSLIPIGGDR